MDTLSLKKYQRSGTGVGKHNQAVRPRPPFMEFFINDTPLSKLLDDFYQSKETILDNWIGVLGTTLYPKLDLIKVKHFLGKTVTDKEISQALLPPFPKDQREYQMHLIREELEDPEILIYCCAECGSRDCGGIAVTIRRLEDRVIWLIREDMRELRFTFNKHQYYTVFEHYMEKL